jgi:hypothetical protein
MNPEGKQTPNTGSNIGEKIQQAIEQRDRTRASQSTPGHTQQQSQPSVYQPGETAEQFEQRMMATKMTPEQLAKFKKSSPHLFPPNQTPKPPSASL